MCDLSLHSSCLGIVRMTFELYGGIIFEKIRRDSCYRGFCRHALDVKGIRNERFASKADTRELGDTLSPRSSL